MRESGVGRTWSPPRTLVRACTEGKGEAGKRKARRGGRAILGAGTGKEERGVGPRPRRSSSAGSSPSGVGQKRKEGGEVGDDRRGPPGSEGERKAAACWAFLAGGPRVAAGPR